jgi:addiction module HigA family antidote
MLPDISKVKGIHPGAILKREIKIRGIKASELAAMVQEYKQTIHAILNERRGINPMLSIKLAKHLGVDDDYFMLLQASYEVKFASQKRKSEGAIPNVANIRKILFWDTNFDRLDWQNQKSAIVTRIFERGNEDEIREIISFYGLQVVKQILKNAKSGFLPSFNENIEKYT